MRTRIIPLLLACIGLFSPPRTAHADPRRQAPVPAGLEIELLDPGVDPVGNPAVLTTPDANGQLLVDIPPTVLVHRYYYTGNRNFQGPMLPGGPAIVVVNHPKTQERCYIEMQMLPGAPRVYYTAHAIEYDYGKQGITLAFGLCGNPKVTYRNCQPLTRRLGNAAAKTRARTKDLCTRAGLAGLNQKACNHAKTACDCAAGAVKTAGKTVLTPVVQVVQILPGAKMLSSSVEQRAANARNSSVNAAANASATSDASIATVR